jgi:hypothetical protein
MFTYPSKGEKLTVENFILVRFLRRIPPNIMNRSYLSQKIDENICNTLNALKPNFIPSAVTLVGFKMENLFSDIAFFACLILWLISLCEGRSIFIMVSIDTFFQ